MSALTPQQAADMLAVSAQTLRRWAVQFSEFLSQEAAPGRGRRRLYTVKDIGTLRRAGELLRSHSVDETIALLRTPAEQADTQALDKMTMTDLIGMVTSAQGLIDQMRGEIQTLAGQMAAQQAELEAMRAQLADLQARRHWWQRFRG